jgi:hypothetical protein
MGRGRQTCCQQRQRPPAPQGRCQTARSRQALLPLLMSTGGGGWAAQCGVPNESPGGMYPLCARLGIEHTNFHVVADHHQQAVNRTRSRDSKSQKPVVQVMRCQPQSPVSRRCRSRSRQLLSPQRHRLSRRPCYPPLNPCQLLQLLMVVVVTSLTWVLHHKVGRPGRYPMCAEALHTPLM